MEKHNKIHFIGIGGIGVSALAGYFLEKGFLVSGSDEIESAIIADLRKMGADIKTGNHTKSNLSENVSRVIFSPAVPPNNPERKEAARRGIQAESYPEALGVLTKKHFTIAVSGSHGKSTTTSMIALILNKARMDPTVIVGTKLKEFAKSGINEHSNFQVGKSQYLLIEADEWQASFLHYWPRIAVVTTLEEEHLDYYRNISHIAETFLSYLLHLPDDGFFVANGDEKNILSLISQLKIQNPRIHGETYSIQQKEAVILRKLLKIPGEHNVSNALAALTVARLFKIKDKVIFEALGEFQGTWRRFEIKQGSIGGKNMTIISDYGHHPTEVLATLKAAREKFNSENIWCVFQPHQYQRTFYLFDKFVDALRKAPVNKLIITDIYSVAGREKEAIKKKVTSQQLAQATKRESVLFVPQKELISHLKKNIKEKDIVVFMGAGDIYKIADSFAISK